MGSEADVSEVSALFERLVRNRDMSLFLPFIFGLSESNSRGGNTTEEEEEEEGQEDQDGETGGRGSTEAPNRERIILVNPFTQGMVVIDGASSLEALLREIGNNNNNNNSNNSFGKGGQPPASKESIEAMPRVEVKGGEEEEEGGGVGECVVCLEELSVGVVVKEMPCRHRFHPDCIETWLGIHGSCPVCRYEMPVEERDEGKKRDEEGGERRGVGGGGGNGEVWVSFSINRDSRRSQEDQNQAPAAGDDDSSDSTSSPSGDAEVEG